MYFNGPHTFAKEWFKSTLLEKFRHIHNPQRIAQIRFVRAKLQHCLSVTDDRVRRLCNRRPLRRKFPENCRQHFFSHPEYILLGCKTHLEVQLIKFSRRAVGSGVLIPKTRRYLKISVKTCCHQKLFILLGCLGQRIKPAFIFSGRNNIISGAFRGGSAQNRCLYLQKPHGTHFLPEKRDDLRTEDDIVFHFLIPQIQITVFQTDFFSCLSGCHHFKRQGFIHFTQYGNALSFQFQSTCGNPGIISILIPFHQNTLDGNTHLPGNALRQWYIAEHYLQYTIHITQIDKGNASVISDIFHPAGSFDGLPDIRFMDIPYGCGSVNVVCLHNNLSSLLAKFPFSSGKNDGFSNTLG